MHADLPRFSGSVEHALDDKGRLIVPARFRERLGTGFVLTIAQPDPCLALYPQAAWADFCSRLEGAPRKDERFRRLGVTHLPSALVKQPLDECHDRLRQACVDRALREPVRGVRPLTRVEIWAKERYPSHAAPDAEAGDLMAELGLY